MKASSFEGVFYYAWAGDVMKLADHLNDKQIQQLEKMKSPKKEKLSTKDIEELMGTRRDRYERRNGAVRRK